MQHKFLSINDLKEHKTVGLRKFTHKQSEINDQMKLNLKNSIPFNDSPDILGFLNYRNCKLSKLKFNQDEANSKIQRIASYEPIKLKSFKSDQDLQISQLERNPKTVQMKYPFGKENIKIAENVLQKYKMIGKQDQKNILKKYQSQARQRKHILKLSKEQGLSFQKIASFDTSIAECSTSKIYMFSNKKNAPQTRLNTEQKNQTFKSEEKKAIQILQSILKNMKQKLRQNSKYLAEKNSKRNTNKIKRRKNQKISTILYSNHPCCIEEYRSKLKNVYPISLTQNVFPQHHFPFVAYTSKDRIARTDRYERLSSDEGSKQMLNKEKFHKIYNIYRLGKQRLDKLSQRISCNLNRNIYD